MEILASCPRLRDLRIVFNDSDYVSSRHTPPAFWYLFSTNTILAWRAEAVLRLGLEVSGSVSNSSSSAALQAQR